MGQEEATITEVVGMVNTGIEHMEAKDIVILAGYVAQITLESFLSVGSSMSPFHDGYDMLPSPHYIL